MCFQHTFCIIFPIFFYKIQFWNYNSMLNILRISSGNLNKTNFIKLIIWIEEDVWQEESNSLFWVPQFQSYSYYSVLHIFEEDVASFFPNIFMLPKHEHKYSYTHKRIRYLVFVGVKCRYVLRVYPILSSQYVNN